MPAMEVLRILSSIANMNRTVYIKDMRINQIFRLGNISRRGWGVIFSNANDISATKYRCPNPHIYGMSPYLLNNANHVQHILS